MGQAIGSLLSFSPGSLLPLSTRLWIGRKLFEPLDLGVWRVSWRRVIKGPVDPPEIEAMQYVAAHTDIPVPRLHAVHIWHKCIYVEMDYIPGDDLASAWLKDDGHLTSGDKKAIMADIGRHISTLRNLKPPEEDLVCSALQNPGFDLRVGCRYFGPMNVSEFQSLIRWHLVMEDGPVLGEDFVYTHNRTYGTRFTHGDLTPRNIIVRGGRVAAIIDWQLAGWYPEYWEFTKAHYNHFPDKRWFEYLHYALGDSYEKELAAEESLWENLPDPGTPYTRYREGETRKWAGSKPSPEWLASREGASSSDLWSVALAQRK